MGLGFLKISSILPNIKSNSAANNKKNSIRKIKEYHIENLVFPTGLTFKDEREIISFIERLLMGEAFAKVNEFSKTNFQIALDLTKGIKEQEG